MKAAASWWAIYIHDRKVAHAKGDPLLAICRASTKANAERLALARLTEWTALHAVPYRGPFDVDVPFIGAMSPGEVEQIASRALGTT